MERTDTKSASTVEPVFGIINSALGFVRFRLRSLANFTNEWSLIALACHC
jgi:hypothetical protein